MRLALWDPGKNGLMKASIFVREDDQQIILRAAMKEKIPSPID